jgi:hypothetical protein
LRLPVVRRLGRLRERPADAEGRPAGLGLNRRGGLLWSFSTRAPAPEQVQQQELKFMATRLRHIAIIVPEPETAAQFFEQAAAAASTCPTA